MTSEKEQILAYIRLLERSEETGRLGLPRHDLEWVKSIARQSALSTLHKFVTEGRHLAMPKPVADEHASVRSVEVVILEQVTPAPLRET